MKDIFRDFKELSQNLKVLEKNEVMIAYVSTPGFQEGLRRERFESEQLEPLRFGVTLFDRLVSLEVFVGFLLVQG